MTIESAADREYAWIVGKDNPNQEWILSQRDVWYRNPFYTGPKGPNPEDSIENGDCLTELEEFIMSHELVKQYH